MRLNKFIAETGLCSRREADAMIAAGRVLVNGQRASLGTVVNEGDEVQADGARLRQRGGITKPKPIYIAFYKPVGITSTTEPGVRGNIVDFIGHEKRIFPIGRLDKDSEGLILLTNDGDIVNQILRSENKVEKEYLVSVDRAVTDDFVRRMAAGVPILGTTTQRCKVHRAGKNQFRIVLVQGLNRQIRRMCEHFDYKVKGLLRLRVGPVQLGHLKPGQWRNLHRHELDKLLDGQPT